MYHIRQACPADLSSAYEIESRCFPPEEAASHEAMEVRLAKFPDRFLVAEKEDGTLIGIINGCCGDEPFLTDDLYLPSCPHASGKPWQMVFGLAVLPEYQGQGIGSALLKALEELCCTTGQQGIILTCKEEKRGYYEINGYVCRGVSDSVHGGKVWYDMILNLK